ncbi:hypothetical protein D3C85_1101720 [compost metagenome]
MQRIELESPLQLLMMPESFLQPQVGLAQLLESLVDGLFRVELIQLLPDSLEFQQQGQLVAQEVEEQPVIGFQGLGSIDDEVGEILLLLAQGQAVPEQSGLAALYAVGAVAQAPDDVIIVGEPCRIESLQSLVVEADQQHVIDGQHLAQHRLQLGKQGMLRQIVGQPHDAADLFYLLLPVRIPLHEGGGLPCQLGAGLGFVQALGQTLQQQSQGRGLLGGAAGQQPLHLIVLHRLHTPSLLFIQPGELFGKTGLFTSQLLLECLGQLMLIQPVQAPIGQPQHGKVLQGAESAQLLYQSGVVLRRGDAGRGKIHDGRNDRQQGGGIWRCEGLD